MRTIKVNMYKMDKIADKMGKKHGKIKKGNEDEYTFLLFTIESNLLKVHRKNPDYKSRRVIDAIKFFLFIIDGYLNDIEYDYSRFENEGNKVYLDALRMAADPFYNEELKNIIINSDYALDDKDDLIELFQPTIKCMIRIKESAELWIEKGGINGYFNFLEDSIGEEVKGDNLDFTVRIKPELLDLEELDQEKIKMKSEVAVTEEEEKNDGDYLQQIKKEFPEIKAYSERKDIIWENKANQYLQQKEYKKAEKLYKKLCLAQPKHHGGFEGLAEVYYNTDQPEKAEWFIKEALKRARKFLEDNSIDEEMIEILEEKYNKIKNC